MKRNWTSPATLDARPCARVGEPDARPHSPIPSAARKSHASLKPMEQTAE
jgi:hypothetical protein